MYSLRMRKNVNHFIICKREVMTVLGFDVMMEETFRNCILF